MSKKILIIVRLLIIGFGTYQLVFANNSNNGENIALLNNQKSQLLIERKSLRDEKQALVDTLSGVDQKILKLTQTID